MGLEFRGFSNRKSLQNVIIIISYHVQFLYGTCTFNRSNVIEKLSCLPMSFQTLYDELFNFRVIKEDKIVLSTSLEMGGPFINILLVAILEFTSRREPFIH
jgi:tRNA splicing ligase